MHSFYGLNFLTCVIGIIQICEEEKKLGVGVKNVKGNFTPVWVLIYTGVTKLTQIPSFNDCYPNSIF